MDTDHKRLIDESVSQRPVNCQATGFSWLPSPLGIAGGLLLLIAPQISYTAPSITYLDDVVFNPLPIPSGSAWELTSLDVGNTAAGSLEIREGGTVTLVDSLNIGRRNGGDGSVVVSGAGSAITAREDLDVATAAKGMMTISDGAVVSSRVAYIGRQNGAEGEVLVEGAGSKWSTQGFMYLGNNGKASLTVADGGAVVSGGVIDIGRNSNANNEENTVLVTGEGSLLQSELSLNIGRNTGRGYLQVKDSGLVLSEVGYLGRRVGTSGRVEISDGGQWLMREAVLVGFEGKGELTVLQGGLVDAVSGSIATQAGSTGAAAVSGTNALWRMSDALEVGDAGVGTLSVSNGGQVQSASGVIGKSGSGDGKVDVIGQDSLWDMTHHLAIGDQGGAQLTISDGGRVQSASAAVDGLGAATGRVAVSGSGALWSTLQLDVGVSGAAEVEVSAGGQVQASNSVLGTQQGSTATVGLMGTGTQWLNQGQLDIGGAGSGTITLEQGALLRSPVVTVAAQQGSNGVLNLISGGQLEATQLVQGAGTAQLNFDGGVLRALTNQSDFISGFAPITLGNNGLTVDTNGYEVTVSAEFAASAGGLIKQGLGTLNIIGSNAYDGGTKVLEGTLQASSAQALGTGVVTVGGDGKFAELHFFGDVRSPQVFGLGGLPLAMMVAEQGLLTGTGVLAGTTVMSGGTISPGVFGFDIATLSIDGDLTFDPGSRYEVLIDTDTGESDRLRVRGVADLRGGILNHTSRGDTYDRGARYEVLSAGTLVGQFAAVTSDYLFLDVVADYSLDPTKVYLGFDRKANVQYSDFAYTANQRATANALETIHVDHPLIEFIDGLTAGEPPAVFDSLSGEIHASVRGSLERWDYALAQSSAQQLRSSWSQLSPECPKESSQKLQANSRCQKNGWSVWWQGMGAWEERSGDGNAAKNRSQQNGLVVGADTELAESGWRVGALLGYGQGDLKVAQRSSSAALKHYTAALYAGKQIPMSEGVLNLSAGLAYSRHSVSSKRSVIALEQILKGDYHADTLQAFAEVGYGMDVAEGLQIEPYVGLNIAHQRLAGFREKGGFAGLESDAQSDTFTSSVLGVRTAYQFDLGDYPAQIRGNLGWKHNWGSRDLEREMAFSAPSSNFSIVGVPLPRNSAVLGLEAEVALSKGSRLQLAVGGEFGSKLSQQAAQLSWRYEF